MYVDRPAPGKGYLLFLYSLIGLFVILFLFMFWKIGNDLPVLLFTIVPSLLPMGIMLALVHAAHHTEYRIENGRLVASSGAFFKETLSLAKIESMEQVRFISRVLGWGFRDKGVCNRFRNGIVIRYNKERLYISPSNCAVFMELMKGSL